MTEPPTKLSILRGLMERGAWGDALRLAAKFPRLPADHEIAIRRGAEALKRPDFYRQVGKDPDRLIEDGVLALTATFADRNGMVLGRCMTQRCRFGMSKSTSLRVSQRSVKIRGARR